MSSGAIITLQFGRYANFVGSHFWNLQDETLGYLEHEVLGPAAQEILAGKLFTHTAQPHPRLVLIDENGCTGGVGLQLNEQDAKRSVLWEGAMEVIEAPKVQPSTFYSLLCDESEQATPATDDDEEAAAPAQECDHQAETEAPTAIETAAEDLDTPSGPGSFTDFLKVVLHPRSVVQVPLLGSSVAGRPTGFGGITAHEDLATQARHDVEEAVRRFAEESDMLEGLQLMCDPQSAWGGLAAACITDLADSYANQTRLLYSVQPPQQPLGAPSGTPGSKLLTETLSAALATAQWCRGCSLVLPMHAPLTTLKGLSYCPDRDFHSSALLAASIDTATLPFRLSPLRGGVGLSGVGSSGACGVPSVGDTSVSAWCSSLAQPAANLACVGMSVPAECSGPGEPSEADMRLSARERRLRGVTAQPQPSAALVHDDVRWMLDGKKDPCSRMMIDSVVWRGARHDSCMLTGEQGAAHLRASLAAEGLRAAHHCCAAAMPLPLPLPFPDIFSSARSRPPAAKQAAIQAGQATSATDSCSNQRSFGAARSFSMLARTAASGVLEGVLRSHGEVLRGSCRSAPGKACLRRWGIDVGDVEEEQEGLLQSADKYTWHDHSSDDDDECFD